ncbi:MAG TPA: DUF3332 family protein [Deltaproteobacteria bacterium]|nr:DUF3332 family protein [Deltaproteobacteria bacterium]
MKRLAVCLVMLSFFVTGCTGSFALTKKVHEFHRSQENKWVDEGIFLVCAVFYIYSIATLADAVIINSIEFWTGDNPIASTGGDTNTIVSNGQNKAEMNFNRAEDTIQIKPQGTNASFTMARTDEGVIVMDDLGNTMYTSAKDSMGGVGIYDADYNMIKYFSPQEVADAHVNYIR